MAKITLQSLTKRFDNHTVLNNLNLTIDEGSFFTLLGPSGCGKTTLLRCLAGFNEPDSGRVLFDTDDITRVPAHERNIGMVFQDYALFPDKTVFDNVAYGLRARRVSKDEVTARVHEALNLVDLKPLAARLPAQLSGGQRQRVALARALVIKPRLLLMDEPLSNLDAKLRLTMREMILSLQKQFRITTVFVTHDQEEALAMSDQIAVMQSGQIAQVGSPQALYESPATAYVADFIGAANLLPVQYIKQGEVQCGEHRLVVNTDATNAMPVLLVLRPEALTLHRAVANSTAGQTLPVRIRSRQYLGSKTTYRVALDETTLLTVDVSDSAPFDIDEPALLEIPTSSKTIHASSAA